MADFTSVGVGLWTWRRFRNLEPLAKVLWIGLYTSHHAKRLVPGLWHGGIYTMVDNVGLSPEQCIRGLDRLLEADLVEYDDTFHVLRMTELPDAHEAASNEKWIKGWWNRFGSIPDCEIRNAHVAMLRWLIDENARHRGKVVSNAMNEVWADTFGTVHAPTMRKRGVQRLEGDSDTSTWNQPSLFTAPPELPTSSIPSPKGYRESSPADVVPDSVPISGKPRNKDLDPHGKGIAEGIAEGLIPSGNGDGKGIGISSLGGSGGLSTGSPGGLPARPDLRLVPEVLPFTPDDLHAVMKTGGARWPWMLSPDDRAALELAIGTIGEVGDAPALLALLRQFLAHGGVPTPGGITPAELASPGRFEQLLQGAIEWQRDSAAKSAALREVLGDPRP